MAVCVVIPESPCYGAVRARMKRTNRQKCRECKKRIPEGSTIISRMAASTYYYHEKCAKMLKII
jgi:hypothetical protein